MRLPRGYPTYPWGDNERLYFGDDNDSSIYWSGTDLYTQSNRHVFISVAAACSLYILDGETQSLRIVYEDASKLTRIKGPDNADGKIFVIPYETAAYPAMFLEGGAAEISGFKATKGAPIKFFSSANPFWSFLMEYDNASVTLMKYPTAVTTTNDLVGLDLDLKTNLTIVTNKGVTALKLHTATKNGAGKSYAIDVTDMTNTDAVLNCLTSGDAAPATWGGAAGIEVSEAPAGWIKIAISGTAGYIPYWV